MSQEHPPPVWNAGTQDSLICLLDQELVVMTTRGCLLGCGGQFLFPWRTLPIPDKTGLPLSQAPSLPDSDVWAPHRENYVPWGPTRPSPAEVAGTRARGDCSTADCSPMESRTSSAFVFGVLLCSFLLLAPRVGGVPASFLLLFSVAGASGQKKKTQSGQSRLWPSWGIPLSSNVFGLFRHCSEDKYLCILCTLY